MTTIISRLFATEEVAASAIAALKKKGFPKEAIDLHEGGTHALPESIVQSLTAQGMYESAARHIARTVQQGGALVVTRAGFGQARKAMAILDAFEPLDLGDVPTALYVERKAPTPAAPTRYLPVLPNRPWLIFSDGFFPPALIKNDRPSSAILLDHKPKASLLDMAQPFSMTAGLPLLSTKGPKASLLAEPFPLSSLFRFPMLTSKRKAA
jgi:hypothetical protein